MWSKLFEPYCCLLCGTEPLQKVSPTTLPYLCTVCTGELSRISYGSGACASCGAEVPSGIEEYRDTCDACRLAPLATRQFRAAGRYAGQIKKLIKHYKYNNRLPLAKTCFELLRREVLDSPTRGFKHPSWDIIVPVPATSSSLRSRGFSQTYLLAKLLGKSLKVPVVTRALQTAPGTHLTRQALLGPDARIENMAGAFRARAQLVRGLSILLLDDVATTGATLNAAAAALTNVGATRVDAIAIAVSPFFTKHRLRQYLSGLAVCSAPGNGREKGSR